MLMIYSPGETEAIFKEMTALSPEQRADDETGTAGGFRKKRIAPITVSGGPTPTP